MKSQMFSLFLMIILLVSACGTYTITSKSFVKQLEDNQDVEEIFHWTPIGSTRYPSNKLDRVVCQNSKGEFVFLYPDQNTSIKIFSKTSKDQFKAYFDTVIFKDEKLYGFRSRIIGGLQEIEVTDIEKIEFHAELPSTKKLSEEELKEFKKYIE